MSTVHHQTKADRLDDLSQILSEGRISRREFVKFATGLGLSLSVLGPILEACSNGTPATTSKSVTVGVVNSPGTFDPAGWRGFTSLYAENHIYQGLQRVTFGSSNLEAALATSWEQPDPLTWVYHLRKGVTFHTGDPFTADDAVYTLTRAKQVSWGSYALVNVDSATALDQYTVQIKLKVPDFRFKWFYYWTPGYIVSKKYIESVGNDKAIANPVGTNAFKFVSSSTTNVVLERYASYWEPGLPKLDRVEFVLLDPSTLISALKTKEVHLSPDVAFNLLQTASSFGDTVMARVGPHSVQTYLNITEKPLNDVLVRQAMAEAMDNKSALAQFPAQYYMPSGGAIIHPSFQYSAYDTVNGVYTSNIDKAKALLARSSAPNGFTLQWITDAQRSQEVAAVVGMQQQLSKIGITVNIQQLPDPSVAAATYTRPRPFQAITSNWLLNMPIALDILVALGASANVDNSNFSGYVNPEYDALLTTAITTTTETERQDAMTKLQQILVRDVPFLPHGWDGVTRTVIPSLTTPPQTQLAEWDDWLRVSHF